MERHITELVDDIDRTTTKDVDKCYVTVDGVKFRIDLKPAHIKELYEALLPFLSVARREGGPKVIPERLRAVLGEQVPRRTEDPERVKPGILKPGRTHTNEECRRLRKWAAEHSIHVSSARISADVWAAFHADEPDMVDPSRRRVA